MTPFPLLEISYITKTFHTKRGSYTALKDSVLNIRQGEFVSLIGHSGCGKSTLLSIVAGLTSPTTGGVIMEGKEVDEAILLSDKIAMMTNGPEATIAEVVKVDLPRPRDRMTIIHHPNYGPLRAQILSFLQKLNPRV